MTIESADAPSLAEVIEQIIEVQAGQIITWCPGMVQTFDSNTQTANVQPMVDGQNLPIVQNIPVTFPGGVYWNVQPDETGIILAGRWDWRGFWRTGMLSIPEDEGQHELAYATYIPGLFPKPSSRTIVGDHTVLLPQVSGSQIRLGDETATESLLHGDAFATEMTKILPIPGFLSALSAWVGQVDFFCGGLAGTAALQTAITNLGTGLGGPWLSPEVKTS